MTLTVRTPGPDDALAIAALHVATWQEAYADLLPPDFFTPEFQEGRNHMWTRILGEAPPELTPRVAEIDGKLIGFALSGPPRDEPIRPRQLYSIYVLAEHYGSGAGQALLDAVLADEPALLWVAAGNERAQAFYRRNGFALDGTEVVDDVGIREVRMLR